MSRSSLRAQIIFIARSSALFFLLLAGLAASGWSCETKNCAKTGFYRTLNEACEAVRTEIDEEVECLFSGRREACLIDGDPKSCRKVEHSQILSISANNTTKKVVYFSIGGAGLQRFFAAFQTAKGWQVVGELLNWHNPSAGGVASTVRIHRFEAKQLIPGGAPEILFEFSSIGHDVDMGLNRVTQWDHRFLKVCALTPKAFCTEDLPLSIKQKRRILFEEEEKKGNRGSDRYQVELRRSYRWNRGKVTIRSLFEHASGGAALCHFPTGTFSIASLPQQKSGAVNSFRLFCSGDSISTPHSLNLYQTSLSRKERQGV